MVCPRIGGSGNPRELDFVKRTKVGVLTSTTIPRVGNLTRLPSWKVEKIWEWVTSGAPSWKIPRIHLSEFPASKYIVRNRPFAGSSHMVRNKLRWDANNAVGLPKQRNSYQSSPTFLCFESPTALFASQHNLFRTMWPDPAKGLLCCLFLPKNAVFLCPSVLCL